MNRRSGLLSLALLPMAVLTACGGGDDDSLDDRIGVADPKVRFVHAVPLAPNMSLFRDDVAQASEVTNVPYKGASRYFDVESNSATWEARTATTPEVDVGDVAFEAERGKKYTLIAVADASSLTDLVLITDPYSKGITADNALVRVFNAAINTDDLDVYLTEPTQDIAVVTPQFAACGYKEAVPSSGNDSVEVDGGAYRLRITRAGTKEVVFDATVMLADNADWLLVVVPEDLGQNNIRVLVVQSDSNVPATELISQ
jgi:hypothetical protein